MTRTAPASRMTASRVTSGRRRSRATATISASNGSRVNRNSSAMSTWAGREIERLIGGIAEQVVEERRQRTMQVDTDRAREQADLPHHHGWHVEDRLPAFAGLEVRTRFRAELPAAGRMKDERVRVGHGSVSHDASPSACRRERAAGTRGPSPDG